MNFTFRSKSDSFVFNTSGNMMLKLQLKAHDWFFKVSKIYDRNLHKVTIYRDESNNFIVSFAIGKLKISIGRAKRPESGVGCKKSFNLSKDSHTQKSKVNNN